ncbi:hypothetical protein V6L77_11325 [Pannonibacter sp. Pt2-lr]|uniref:Uncharacterized protein n=1 Tax=Pannonibacter anstelovis TaxID=3121537 RepID=A0ABU7ZM01_9HYPH
MVAISGTASADLAASGVRPDYSARAAQDTARVERQASERQTDERRETVQETSRQEEQRESRKIPGLGNAVDITA